MRSTRTGLPPAVRRLLPGLLALALIASCSDDAGDDNAAGSSSSDTVADSAPGDASSEPDAASEDAAADAGEPDLGEPDLGEPDLGEPEDTGANSNCPGGAGCACTTNADCDNALCIDTHEGKQCATNCVDSCKTGYTCAKLGATDTVYYCVSKSLALCAPCKTDLDCQPQGGDALCLDYGAQGRFCGSPCEGAADCLDGYSCVDSKGAAGTTTKQCRLDKGVCACSAWASAKGAATVCSQKGEFGTCEAERACTDKGLAPCKADTSGVEVCNTIDDDCNGKTDDLPAEATCTLLGFADQGSKTACKAAKDCAEDGEGCDPASGTCRKIIGGCPGKPFCSATGKTICQAKAPKAEKCDLEDNDCDGQTDEDFIATLPGGATAAVGAPCGKGPCAGGKVTCVNLEGAACSTGYKASKSDNCNGLDDDCDGATDNGACDDHDACTKDSCDPTAKQCSHTKPPDCDDGNVCTEDACKKTTGLCFHSPKAGAICGDGDACTVGDACEGLVCTPGTAKDCDDGKPCTDDSCHNIKGCLNLPVATTCTAG